MNLLNIEAAAKNLMVVDTIYGPRRASRRVFRISKKIDACSEGTQVRLIGDLPEKDPTIDWIDGKIPVNTLQSSSSRTFYAPLSVLEALHSSY